MREERRLGRRKKGKKPHTVPEPVRSTWAPNPKSIHLSLSLQYKQKTVNENSKNAGTGIKKKEKQEKKRHKELLT